MCRCRKSVRSSDTLCLKGVPLTRRFAPPAPRKRGEGRRVVALLPADERLGYQVVSQCRLAGEEQREAVDVARVVAINTGEIDERSRDFSAPTLHLITVHIRSIARAVGSYRLGAVHEPIAGHTFARITRAAAFACGG